MGRKGSVLALVILIGLSGCAVTINPDGFHAVVGGTYYGHADDQSEKGAEDTATKDKSRWRTYAARTWGTSGIEGKITTDSELISIQGAGISDNLSKTLGDDIVDKIGDDVSCMMQPMQPKCAAAR
jgi:uncharacterized protein YceK